MTNIICGVVNADGSIYSGIGYKVDKKGTGQYYLTFAAKFSNTPAVVTTTTTLTGRYSGLDVTSVSDPAVEHVTVWTHDNSGGTADRPFSFIAAG
ncbi:hypothetical protein ACIQMJ_27035 [Actinosynnema sp. NPDC091369]